MPIVNPKQTVPQVCLREAKPCYFLQKFGQLLAVTFLFALCLLFTFCALKSFCLLKMN